MSKKVRLTRNEAKTEVIEKFVEQVKALGQTRTSPTEVRVLVRRYIVTVIIESMNSSTLSALRDRVAQIAADVGMTPQKRIISPIPWDTLVTSGVCTARRPFVPRRSVVDAKVHASLIKDELN